MGEVPGWATGVDTDRPSAARMYDYHSLGLTVTAEGVETEARLERLRRVRCDSAQGYLFCAPLPADALARWLDTPHRADPAGVFGP
ncbi:hypothetical protein FRACA_280019 [Frankia canadensis]|uniref:EAL domain-containing protein n=1 Tax=Frankia canadensis TaxID=1836972 RepID=A0A2I2KT02_9ACTN|nr:EAL domain-containing protein [Frankia canadensis]SNQ48797.1 hypothetical protein FRACA_280019 [Frankia canadensis]SOU56087.1 hypothetical protein FRACA_280019 [Frankia canadensis]